jgi:chromosome partitioning protein
MKTLAVLARKGGVGKTTVAVHLAVVAQQAGRRVLLIDADPQRSAAGWWRERKADEPELVEADPRRLPEILAAAAEDGVDLAVIDTRPSAEADAAMAAKLANLSLVVTRPAILDLRAIGATTELVKASGRPGLIVLNACPAGRDGAEAVITREAREGLAAYGLPVARTSLGLRAAMSHALIDGRAVTEFDADGKAASEIRSLWKEIARWQSSNVAS